MTLRLRPEAQSDMLEAAHWYEDREPGLGSVLIAAIDDALVRIEAGPLRYPKRHKRLRRALVQRFPYSIFFDFDGADVVVFAVWHQSRATKILDDRLKV